MNSQLDSLVDNYELNNAQEFPKAGCSYSGNPWNFYLDYGGYNTELDRLTTLQKIEIKLEQLKKDPDALPWE